MRNHINEAKFKCSSDTTIVKSGVCTFQNLHFSKTLHQEVNMLLKTLLLVSVAYCINLEQINTVPDELQNLCKYYYIIS